MNQKPTLVIMAAGMGSRFGGLKQITPIDPEGHFIIDYSLFDAWRAGFRRVVFIIKEEMEQTFREKLGDRISRYFEVVYVHQRLDDLPEGYSVPAGRERPWGTCHAAASCRRVLSGPFAVINSDDFYGQSAFRAMFDFLNADPDSSRYAMVCYRLRNTLTENGSVARGVCEEENGRLVRVTERTKIFQKGTDAVYTEDGQTFFPLAGDTPVSMNFWGFPADAARQMWARFPAFLDEKLAEQPLRCEYYLPSFVSAQIAGQKASVTVLPCEELWHGVTYQQDLPAVQSAIAALVESGVYTRRLWP